MANNINVDLDILWREAGRLNTINDIVTALQGSINNLYWRTGNGTIWNISHNNVLGKNAKKLNNCKNALNTVANDLAVLEKSVESGGLVLSGLYSLRTLNTLSDNKNINNIWADIIDKLKNSHTGFPDVTEDMGKYWEVIKETFAQLPENAQDAGDALAWLEEAYNQLPHALTHGIEVFLLPSLIPDTLKDSYTLTSGILQGDLTLEDCWDVAKNILPKKTEIVAICETLEYTFETGAVRNKEMERELLDQIKEGDFLGAAFDGAEGFVDIIIGGSVEVLGDLAGGYVDSKIDNMPVIKGINLLTEYATGLLGWNEGEGYSVGGLIGAATEKVSEGIDAATDFITDATDVVTDAITDGAKAGINWVKSWFD